jgi:hypothetical protein
MNYPKLNFSFKSVDIESPIPELKVGDDFKYCGTYFEEYEVLESFKGKVRELEQYKNR